MQEPCEPLADQSPSFGEVLKQYRPMLAHLIRSFHSPGRPYPDFDDLAQVATIALWDAYTRCTNWLTFPAFAKCVVKAALIDLVRRERGSALPLSSYVAPWSLEEHNLLDTLASPLADEDLRLAVQESLSSLPRRQATNVWAVYGVGFRATEWARFRRQHVNTIKQSLARGRRNFRKKWLGAPD